VIILTELEVVGLNEKCKEIRKIILEMIGTLGVGHIGGSLSIVETLVVLYYKEMKVDPKNPHWEERDRFVLSKGHAGPALYAVLADKGFFPYEWIYTLNKPQTNLPSHCDRLKTPGVDMTAGSLGQGFPAAVGMAMAAKLDNMQSRIYAIVGDGESQEGSVWEALMLAGNKKLDNLTAFIDYNKMQIDDYVENINSLEPIADKYRAFNWNVLTVDGHDVRAIYEAVQSAKQTKGKPSMIILDTVKGKGFKLGEGKVSSHNMNITEEQWKQAVEELYK
jgi:transketolase